MKHPPNSQQGYSLMELLVVFAIVGILSVAAVFTLGNRSGNAVRGILDELEGNLMEAHKLAVATGQDVLIVTQGDWSAATPMLMARSAINPATLPAPTEASILAAGGTAPESFRLAVSGGVLSREHKHAGVVALGSAWWGIAKAGSEDILTVAPFAATGEVGFMGGFNTALISPNRLFQGAATTKSVRISGANKRFTSTFWIPVVSISGNNAVPGGALGVIFVQNNGATIFKFYNPGIKNGDGKWRRL